MDTDLPALGASTKESGEPVLISLQTRNKELLFTRCCLTMMSTKSDLLYLLVDQPLPDPFSELYQNYRIMVFTPEEFLEQLNKL